MHALNHVSKQHRGKRYKLLGWILHAPSHPGQQERVRRTLDRQPCTLYMVQVKFSHNHISVGEYKSCASAHAWRFLLQVVKNHTSHTHTYTHITHLVCRLLLQSLQVGLAGALTLPKRRRRYGRGRVAVTITITSSVPCPSLFSQHSVQLF